MLTNRFPQWSKCLLTALSLLVAAIPGYSRAFPTAEGFGANAVGGRGGKVLHVTNTQDYDPDKDTPIPGSLRAALEAKDLGPRIVVFDVSGAIYCDKPVNIIAPYLTIAGQTAPSPGIVVAAVINVRAPNVIIRHLRVAPGDPSQHPSITYMNDYWPIGAWGEYGTGPMILDHCSLRWCLEDHTQGGGFMTIQHCLIAEGLEAGIWMENFQSHTHGKGYANYGHTTFHHNIIAKMLCRNPCVHNGNLDFVNNLVYDWGNMGRIHVATPWPAIPVRANFVGNYYKSGKDTPADTRPLFIGFAGISSHLDAASLVYLQGNLDTHFRTNNSLPQDAFYHLHNASYSACDRNHPDPGGGLPISSTRLGRFGGKLVPPVKTQTAEQARDYLLSMTRPHVGATVPGWDAVDRRIMTEIVTGTGGIIEKVADVGGYPKLAENYRPKGYDTDGDGMPDAWEKAHKLNPRDPGDANRIVPPGASAHDRHAGYTYIEYYINGRADNLVH